MQAGSARHVLPTSYRDRYDVAAFLLFFGLVVLVLLTYRSYGISNDEGLQQRYGELIISYYASGFTNRAVFEFDNLYLYGGLFDILATLIGKVVPLDLYDIRHILCAFTGIGGIAAAWGAARLIAGSRAGLIAATILAVCGAWYGAMFNHTKDVTFATAMMGGIYMLLRAMRDLPRPRLRDVLLFGAVLGAALGLRAIGLLLGFFFGAAILLKLFDSGCATNRDRLAFVIRSVVAFIPGLILAYLIMIAAWPWSALAPLNPVRAIFAFAEFHYNIRDLLAGQILRMNEMPRWYLPAYLAIKLPLALWAGVASALIFAAVPRLTRHASISRTRCELALVAFVVALPILTQVIGRGPAFSGIRHFTFVVPPLAVLAGIGLDALIAALTRWRVSVAIAAGAAIGALLMSNAVTLVRLHPYEYLFYNALVGGLPGATGRYATDYWSNSMPEGIHALEAFLAQSGQSDRRYKVSTCSEALQFEHVASKRLQLTDIWEEADFFISATHMGCDKLLQGQVIATVERLGVTIAVVKDRRAIIGTNTAHDP